MSPTCRRAGTRASPGWADPGVVRAFVDRGVEAPWSHQLAAADLAHDGRQSSQHRYRVGQVIGLPIADLDGVENARYRACIFRRPRRSVTTNCARRHADRAVPVGATSHRPRRRRQPRRGPPLARERSRWIFSNPDMIHLSMLAPRPLGGVPTQPAVHRRRRMSLLPRIFGSTWRWCCAGCCDCVVVTPPPPQSPDGNLRQRHHRIARVTASS